MPRQLNPTAQPYIRKANKWHLNGYNDAQTLKTGDKYVHSRSACDAANVPNDYEASYVSGYLMGLGEFTLNEAGEVLFYNER